MNRSPFGESNHKTAATKSRAGTSLGQKRTSQREAEVR
jgi:hypothetical protein